MCNLKYDRDTGHTPRLNDKVVVCHTSGPTDGLTGMLAGWSDICKYCAIVLLDKKLPTGETCITMPIVCLDLVKTVVEPKMNTLYESAHDMFDYVCTAFDDRNVTMTVWSVADTEYHNKFSVTVPRKQFTKYFKEVIQ